MKYKSKEIHLSSDELRLFFMYDPDTGNLYRRLAACNNPKLKEGSLVGSIHKQSGYLKVNIEGLSYMAHRVIWKLFYGVDANLSLDIDHINGNKLDNRIANLRILCNARNQANNKYPRSNNKLGVRGVYKKGDIFIAQIGFSGDKYSLGYYKTVEEAEKAYLEARDVLYKNLIV
jgi:hypothetical protein